MVIEELGAVVAIKAAQGEGQRLLNGFNLRDNAVCVFVPRRPALSPARVDVG